MAGHQGTGGRLRVGPDLTRLPTGRTSRSSPHPRSHHRAAPRDRNTRRPRLRRAHRRFPPPPPHSRPWPGRRSASPGARCSRALAYPPPRRPDRWGPARRLRSSGLSREAGLPGCRWASSSRLQSLRGPAGRACAWVQRPGKERPAFRRAARVAESRGGGRAGRGARLRSKNPVGCHQTLTVQAQARVFAGCPSRRYRA